MSGAKSLTRFVQNVVSEARGPVATYPGAPAAPASPAALTPTPLSWMDSESNPHHCLVLGFDAIGVGELA